MSGKDENASALSEATTVATDSEMTLETAMENIFCTCDSEGSGFVLTSKLIEYISPYMACNRTELMQLQEMLDPDDKNVLVAKETFWLVMKEWAGRIRAADDIDNNFHQATPGDFYKIEEEDFPFVQSTPRSSFGHHFLEGYAASGVTNLSSVSTNAEPLSAVPDKIIFEDQLKELTHQNRKLTEELTQTKVQLTSSEEQIESLQADLNKVVRRLNSEQLANEQLQNQIKEVDNTKESASDILLQYNELKVQKTALEKDYTALREKYYVLDDEKQDLVLRLEEFRKKERDWEETVTALNKEINSSEEKISNLEVVNDNLKLELKEVQSVAENYKQRSEEFSAENQTLQKLLHKLQLNQNLSYCSTSGIHSNSFQSINLSSTLPTVIRSPLEKIRQQLTGFNSPKLIRQLNNPLSPLTQSPDENQIIENKNPEFISAIKSSTPKQTLLDDSIPVELAQISVLCPNKLDTGVNNAESPSVIDQKDDDGEQQKASTSIIVQEISEEDYFNVNLTQILEKQSPHNSLLAELSEANGSCTNGKDCMHLLYLMEIKDVYVKLEQQQKIEIERLKKQNEEYQQQIDQLNLKINELNEMNKSNDRNSEGNNSTTYITEVRMHLDQEAGDASCAKTVEAIALHDFKEKLEILEKEKHNLTLKINILQEDNDKLQEKQINISFNLKKVVELQDELKTELESLFAQNYSLKQTIEKNIEIAKATIDEIYERYTTEKTEWEKQKHGIENQVTDVLMEVAILQQKLEKSEVSSEISDASSTVYSLSDDSCKDKNVKGTVSFSKMQMKIDRLQEKFENLQDLLQNERNKNDELQLQISKIVAKAEETSAENKDLIKKLSENEKSATIERNQLESQLIEAKTALQNNEIKMFSLKTRLNDLSGKMCELKEIETNIANVADCIYESNLHLVSLLANAELFKQTFTSLLNSWDESIRNNLNNIEVSQLEEPLLVTVIKSCLSRMVHLKEMAFYNKAFLNSLKNVLETRNPPLLNTVQLIQSSSDDSLTVRSSGFISNPASPDSPSLCDVSNSTLLTEEESNKNKETQECDCKDLSASSVSLDSIEKCSLHSDSKVDDVHSLHSIFEENSLRCAFPNFSDDLLQFLNIYEDLSRNEIGDNEIEEKYSILMTALTTDGLSIKLRLEKETTHLVDLKKCFLTDLHRLLAVIPEKCKAKQLQDITQAFSRVCASAEIYGAVREEAKIHSCLKLIRNYVTTLKKKLEQSTISKPSLLRNVGKGILRWSFYGVCILILLTIFTILGNVFTEIVFGGDGITRVYRVKFLSWDELLTPISKKVYCSNGCPH